MSNLPANRFMGPPPEKAANFFYVVVMVTRFYWRCAFGSIAAGVQTIEHA